MAERSEATGLNEAVQDVEPNDEQARVLHRTIMEVTHDTERMEFNTAIARMMEFVNFFLSVENNQYYSEKIGSPPSNMNSEIPEKIKPWIPSADDIEKYGRAPDAKARAAHIDDWTTRWDTQIAPLIQK